MSNVLPESARKKVWSMYRGRLITVASLSAIAAALLSAVALAPIYISLRLEVNALPHPADMPADNTDRTALQHTQTLLKALRPVLATTTPSMALEQALAVKPSGATVTAISYAAGNPGTIYLSGSASRDVINQYQQKLQSVPLFKKVVVPLGDLAGAGDGTFSITLSGSF